jgi:DNA-binding transcriptional ArsR family regulator
VGGGTRTDQGGVRLLSLLTALSHPQRIRILASLADGRNYVSQLARDVELGRPLVHMHLQRLEAAGLVKGQLELSEDGRAMKYFEIVPFRIEVTPAAVVAAAASLGDDR